jgi:hypothetical protein
MKTTMPVAVRAWARRSERHGGSAGGCHYLMFYVPLPLTDEVLGDALERMPVPALAAQPVFRDSALAR